MEALHIAEFVLQIAHYLVWFPLAVLVMQAILRVGVSRYPLIFAYMVVMFLSVMAQMPTALAYHRAGHSQSAWFQVLHSISEGITYPLILAVVVSLMYRATEQVGARHLIRAILAVGAPLFTAISFAVHFDRNVHVGVWMTPWTRDLNFCAAILDLILWTLLLASRRKEYRLLLLAGGMGINFAGGAVADAVRSVAIHYRSFPTWISADVLALVADGAALYIWWQAFRRDASETAQVVPAKAAVNH